MQPTDNVLSQAKSKLYEKMTSGNILPDEESAAVFLVDFEKKSIDARMKRKNVEQKPKLGVNVSSELGGCLVIGTLSSGRCLTCPLQRPCRLCI